ncbi:hypothetical protein [Pseudomonas sp. BF-R-21]|uniref:hypothetical protein n=1 Tax=Pseudomonas sp. BF-R-21 TaxID=2832387 RepID=UPI001CBDA9F9|nr:hypothetical protein [Pseudomonas sp. BF-R-21]
MSTRATYQFESADLRQAITLYIHTDGYEEGAAEYFKDACLFNNARGGLAEAFIRANDRAEITGSHQTHADTEYRYTLGVNNHLIAEKRTFTDSEQFGHNNWKGVWNGPLLDFIHAKTGVKLLALPGRYLDQDGANSYLLERIEEMNRQIKAGWTGNASGTANEVWRLIKDIERTYGNSKMLQTAIKCVDSADVYFAGAFGWADNLKVDDVEAVVRWQASFREGRERLIAEYVEIA